MFNFLERFFKVDELKDLVTKEHLVEDRPLSGRKLVRERVVRQEKFAEM